MGKEWDAGKRGAKPFSPSQPADIPASLNQLVTYPGTGTKVAALAKTAGFGNVSQYEISWTAINLTAGKYFGTLAGLSTLTAAAAGSISTTGKFGSHCIRTLVKLSMETPPNLLSAMALTLWLLPNYKRLTLPPSEPSTLLSPRASGPLVSGSKSPRDQLPSPPQQLLEPPTSPSVPPLPSQPSASSERHESYDQYLHFSN